MRIDDLSANYKKDLYPFKRSQLEPIKRTRNYLDGDILQHGYLYVIYNEITNLFKIGVTNDIKERHRQLERISGCNLHVYFIVYFECCFDEKKEIAESYLHNYFKDKRVKKLGEWFRLDGRDLAKIRYWASIDLNIDYFPLNSKESYELLFI